MDLLSLQLLILAKNPGRIKTSIYLWCEYVLVI
jgi:hypothetical protein